jgi:uncharacterized protein
MPNEREKSELIELSNQIEKESVRKLRENKSIAFALRFSSHAQEKIDQVRADVVRKGVHFDCQRGCAYCCHFQVQSLPQETFRIARDLKSRGDLQPVLDALTAFVDKTAGLPASRHREKCPFLVANECSIYAVRPAICRKCNSLDVETCKDMSGAIAENAELAYKTGAILNGTVAAYRRNKLSSTPHQLGQGVLLALTDPTAERRWQEGEAVFPALAE